MLVDSIQLPDLWLKVDMARVLAVIPSSGSVGPLKNSNFIGCIRGDDESVGTFNKWLTGDAGLRRGDDLPLLAALLYRMVREGITKATDHTSTKLDVKNRERLDLADPLLGTIFDFGIALVNAAGDRPDGGDNALAINAMLRNALLNSMVNQTVAGGQITVLHSETRDWAHTASDSERLARKAQAREVRRGQFIQYVVPPSSMDQLVFGFEILSEQRLVGAKWRDVASWFPPTIQKAGKALMLLDEPEDDADAYRAESDGECTIQIVGVDLDHLSTTGKLAPSKARAPHDLYRLAGNYPVDWPEGYAETMAMLTYVERLSGYRTRVMNRNDLDSSRVAKTGNSPPIAPSPVPPLPRLYQGRYRVI